MSTTHVVFLLALLTLGCTASHAAPGDPCELAEDGTSDCPEGMHCAIRTLAGERSCRTICMPHSRRCESGEVCLGGRTGEPWTCWTGGDGGEGAPCEDPYDCAAGLSCADDVSGPDLAARCEPVCTEDSHCERPGEACVVSAYCAVPCDSSDPSSCPTGTVCQLSRCMWAPRAADCDHDGNPECPVGQICQDTSAGPECRDPW